MTYNKLANKLSALATGLTASALLVTAPIADARDTLQKFPIEAARRPSRR